MVTTLASKSQCKRSNTTSFSSPVMNEEIMSPWHRSGTVLCVSARALMLLLGDRKKKHTTCHQKFSLTRCEEKTEVHLEQLLIWCWINWSIPDNSHMNFYKFKIFITAILCRCCTVYIIQKSLSSKPAISVDDIALQRLWVAKQSLQSVKKIN